MLIHALTKRFDHYFAQVAENDTILWFDPEQEYAGLLDYLTSLPLWPFGGSLLQLRYRLLHRAPGERAVVYLPLAREDAETLRPFFATSLVFRERLYKLLRRHGLAFPDDPNVAHEMRDLLPRLAARSLGKGRAFWEYNLANLERARETLIGNPDDTLLRFLSQPQSTLAELKREQLDGLFFAQLESAYGLVAVPEDDPDSVAQRLTAQLALTCAHFQAETNLREHGYGPPDFPYPDRLAEPMYRDRCWAFLTRWQNDRLYGQAYARLADSLQSHYDLRRWAVNLPQDVGLTLRDTFANVQEALWAHVTEVLDSLGSEDEWRDWLQAHDGPIGARAQDFWARQGRDPGWELLDLARDLLTAIHGLRRELDRWIRPVDALRAYSGGWYCIDQDYRRLREALGTSSRSHDRLRERCAHAYRDILRQMNDRFCTLLDAEASWPPQQSEAVQGTTLLPQHDFWPQVRESVQSDQRVAVMFVDALRYELAQELWGALDDEGAGDRRELGARLACIPTVTAIGMAALLPGGDRCQVDYDGGWKITIEDSHRNLHSDNLKDKSARRQWLAQHLPDARFYNLDELLNTATDRIPEAAAYVVFDTTLDAVGETASSLAWNAFSTLLQSVKKGVHKLLALGVGQVHVVSDHGFLLLDEIGEHEKVSVRDVPALAKRSRYVVGRHLGHTDQLCFVVSGSDGLTAWYPRGIGCFRTPGPYNYVHGGLSLQELVVPHLVVTQQVMGKRVRVRADLPREIRMAQPRVHLEPESADLFDQPRQLTLSLEKDGEPIMEPLSHVVGPTGSVTMHVLLPMGCGLQSGDRVRWILKDANTGEVLTEQEAVSRIDVL